MSNDVKGLAICLVTGAVLFAPITTVFASDSIATEPASTAWQQRQNVRQAWIERIKERRNGRTAGDDNSSQAISSAINSGHRTGKRVFENVQVGRKKLINNPSRAYTLYIPSSYTAEKAYPVVFSFHGFGSDMEKNYEGTKFYELAEKEQFIVVHPQGLAGASGKRKWNVFGIKRNPDVTFTKYLLNTLGKNYHIDTTRIYTTGMSNGGYFSFLLACSMSDTFAGVASVTGAMFKPVHRECNPTRPVPVMQIHGTDDPVVKYNTAKQAVDFWVNHNHSRNVPVISELPDSDKTDGSTVTRYVYKNKSKSKENNGFRHSAEVQHLKVSGGKHAWPGAKGGKAGTNQDINASHEIWQFFKRFELE